MLNAADAGRQFAESLDEIKEKGMAVGIIQAKNNVLIEQYKTASRMPDLTKEQRIIYAKAALELEQADMQRNLDLAQQTMDAQLRNAEAMTGLKGKQIEELILKRVQPAPTARNFEITLDDIMSAQQQYQMLGKLNEDEQTALTESIKNYYNVQSSFYAETSRIRITMSKLNKGILDEDENDIKQYSANYKNVTDDRNQYLLEAQKRYQESQINLMQDAEAQEKARINLKFDNEVADLRAKNVLQPNSKHHY